MATTQVSTSVLKDGSVTSAKLDTNIAITGNLIVDTNTLYVDSTNNRVGIGTNSPIDQLHIKSSTTDARMVLDGHTGFDAELKFYEAGTAKYTVGYDAATANFVIGTINVDTNQRLVIDSSGNVGIGTSSPAEKLSVQGAIISTGGITGHGANRATLSQEGANGAFLQSYGANTSTYGSFQFRQASSDFSLVRTPLIINSSGNVGIGVSPSTELHVKGSAEIFRIDDSSSTGSPFMTFFQNGTRRGLIQLLNGGLLSLVSEYGGVRFMTGTGGTEVERMRITSGGDISFRDTSANEAFYWDASTARLGIGVGASPSAGIHVKHGSITTSSNYSSFLSNATAKIVANHSSEYGVSIGYANATTDTIGIQSGNTAASRPLSLQPYGGSVGIGTDSPGEILHVQSLQTTAASNAYVNIFSGHQAAGGSDITGEAGIIFKHYSGSSVYRRAGAIVSARENNYSTDNNADSYLRFETTKDNVNTERMRILSSGGITFNGDTATANALDDYEEGTFTPTAYGATTTGTTTYTYQNGNYTKIGRQVTVNLAIGWSALTGTGRLRIGGLPFTGANVLQNYSQGSILVDGLNWSGGTFLTTIQILNANFMEIYGLTDNGNAAPQICVNESVFARITITYFAA